MKLKHCIFALGLVGAILPLILQGAPLLRKDGGGGGGGPSNRMRSSMLPVMVEAESGMLRLSFTRDLGEVTVELRDATGLPVISQPVNTTVQPNESLMVQAGTYLLTVTTAEEDEEILIDTTIVIP